MIELSAYLGAILRQIIHLIFFYKLSSHIQYANFEFFRSHSQSRGHGSVTYTAQTRYKTGHTHKTVTWQGAVIGWLQVFWKIVFFEN